MPINPKSAARKSKLLADLASVGIKATSAGRSMYRVDRFTVSIRTTTKPGPKLWYDVSERILSEVDYLIYQADSEGCFSLFPVAFFRQRYSLLQDSNRPTAKIFYIDWGRRQIVSHPNFQENISSYCCSTFGAVTASSLSELLLAQQGVQADRP